MLGESRLRRKMKVVVVVVWGSLLIGHREHSGHLDYEFGFHLLF